MPIADGQDYSQWSPGLVMARMVEAADTIKYLRGDGPANCKAFWPGFQQLGFQQVDGQGKPVDVWKDVYDDAARADFLDRWQRQHRAPEGAIDRFDECNVWIAKYLEDPIRRRIVLVWARCQVDGQSFGAKIKKMNLKKDTAYRRLTDSLERISRGLVNNRVLLKLPDVRFLRHETPIQAIGSIQSGRSDDAPKAIRFSPGYRTEPSRDTLDTPEKIADFAKVLQRRNARMRKIQSWRDEVVA